MNWLRYLVFYNINCNSFFFRLQYSWQNAVNSSTLYNLKITLSSLNKELTICFLTLTINYFIQMIQFTQMKLWSSTFYCKDKIWIFLVSNHYIAMLTAWLPRCIEAMLSLSAQLVLISVRIAHFFNKLSLIEKFVQQKTNIGHETDYLQ